MGCLVKTFVSHTGLHYAYDGNTHAILRLDELSVALVKHWGQPAFSRRVVELQDRWGRAAVEERCRALEQLSLTRGVLLPSSVDHFMIPANVGIIRRRFNNRLNNIVLNVTGKCNLRCHYCIFSGRYREYASHNRSSMSWPVARAAIDLLLARSKHQPVMHLGFYGGEPLLELPLIRKSVSYLRRYAAGRKVQFHLTTNGTLLNEQAVRFLIRHEFWLVVSLDGPRDIHDAVRVGPGDRPSWQDVIAGLERIRRQDAEYYRTHIILNSVVGPNADLTRLEKFFGDTAGPVAGLQTMLSGIKTNEDPEFLKSYAFKQRFGLKGLTDLRKRFLDSLSHSRKNRGLSWSLFASGLRRVVEQRKPVSDPTVAGPLGMCIPGWDELAVDGDGKLSPCPNMPSGITIGDVWNGPDPVAAHSLLERFCSGMITKCRNCWAVRLCSMCLVPAGSGAFAGHPNSHECGEHRQRLLEGLQFYATVLEQGPPYTHNSLKRKLSTRPRT